MKVPFGKIYFNDYSVYYQRGLEDFQKGLDRIFAFLLEFKVKETLQKEMNESCLQ